MTNTLFAIPSPSVKWASNMLRSNAVILDTETTGLDGAAQIIQLSIIDMSGATLFDSLCRPTCDIGPGAYAVHGLTKDHLADAPAFPAIADQARDILIGKVVIIYNAEFDMRMLRQTYRAFDLDAVWLRQLDTQCAMRVYAASIGGKRRVPLRGGDHSAVGDCLAVLRLIKQMAGEEEQSDQNQPTRP